MDIRSNIKRALMEEIGKERVAYGTVAFIGYILSPLSWWNDIFVNIPISYVVAWLISLIVPEAFLIVFTLMYVATNILGFILMHLGIEGCIRKNIKFDKKTMIRYIIVSTIYTVVVVILIQIGLMVLS